MLYAKKYKGSVKTGLFLIVSFRRPISGGEIPICDGQVLVHLPVAYIGSLTKWFEMTMWLFFENMVQCQEWEQNYFFDVGFDSEECREISK